MAKFVVPVKMCWSADSVMAPPQQLAVGSNLGLISNGDDYFDPKEVIEEVIEEVVEEVVEEEVVEEEVEEEVVELLEDKPKKRKSSKK